jgi:hypothetical protein
LPADVRPYLVPRDDTVVWEPWELRDDAWVELPNEIDGWDTGTDLVVRRLVRVDVDRLRSETHLDPKDVVVTVSWTNSSTGMRDAVARSALPGNGICSIEATLPGARVSGIITVRTALCLGRRNDSTAPGVARLPGSVLAENVRNLTLERDQQAFPVGEVDFAATRLPAEASWHLETSTDLTAPFFGAFRVLINRRDTELCKAVSRGVKDRRQQALLEELEGGVASLLLELALNMRPDLVDGSAWPDDSVGDVLLRILQRSSMDGATAPGVTDLNLMATRINAAVRRAGQGRLFV